MFIFSRNVQLDPLATAPNLRWRYSLAGESGLDTLFVDWSTVYNKTTGLPAESYELSVREMPREGRDVYASFTSLGSSEIRERYDGETTVIYADRHAHVRRDTLLFDLNEEVNYQPQLSSVFPVVNLSRYIHRVQYVNWDVFSYVDYDATFATLSVNPTFVREDAGATTIEIKAQLAPSTLTPDQDLRVTPVPRWGLNRRFYLDAPTLVIEGGERSATGQMTITPINDEVKPHNFDLESDQDFFITIEIQKEGAFPRGISACAHPAAR